MAPSRESVRHALTWGLRVFLVHLVVIAILVCVRYLIGIGPTAGAVGAIQRAVDLPVAGLIESNYQKLPAGFFTLLGVRPVSLFFADLILYGLLGGMVYFLVAFAVTLIIDRRTALQGEKAFQRS